MGELSRSWGGAAAELRRSWGGAGEEPRRRYGGAEELGSDVVARGHVAIADRLGQRGREPWNISTRVNMERARLRRVSRTLYNYTGWELPSRATPDTPPLAAAMFMNGI